MMTQAEAAIGGADAAASAPAVATAPTPRRSGKGKAAAAAPYTTNLEHLWDELARVDRLVRARTLHWRATLAASKPEGLWGMLHVSDREVDAYLGAPFAPPGTLPPELEGALRLFQQEAAALERLIEARRRATGGEVDLRLPRLSRLFGLSDLERDVLLVCLLPELDGRYRRLFGYLMDDASRTCPTVELVLEILAPETGGPEAGRDAFGAGSALVSNRLLAGPDATAGEPLPMRPVRLDDRIAGFLLGSDEPDGRLEGVVPASGGSAGEASPSAGRGAESEEIAAVARIWRERCRADAGLVCFLHGPYGSGRLAAAREIAAGAGTPLLAARVEAACRSPEGVEAVVALAYREAALAGAALCWTGCERLLAEGEPSWLWDRLTAAAEAFPGLTCLASELPWEPAGRFREPPLLRLDLACPGYPRRRLLWERHLPREEAFAPGEPDRETLAAALANDFQLTGGRMADAVATARAVALCREGGEPRLTAADLYAGCRRQSGGRLAALARRIEPRTELTFDALVLPGPNRRQLEELRARIRHRGRVAGELGFERRLSLGKGLVALFTGSSGTGKTLAAELLAREQGVDLYKIDLAAVVSKYVGETEKNLNRLFAEAEGANAILFFDEADALFGKRGEVKAAQDRWANLEINYLLQRVEEYAGVVVLASNLRQNVDDAFLRRIQVIVEFPFPDAAARLAIWQGLFPEGLERPADGDLRTLADRFRLAGGSIKNIVLDAAYRTLAEGGGKRPAITLRHLVLATAREHQKLGKPVTPSAFGEELHALLDEEGC